MAFLGTPAEEGHSGKEYMIRGGMLDGIDAAVMMHPFSFDICSHVWVGRRTLSVTFTEVPAHASSQPFMGRNALDASWGISSHGFAPATNAALEPPPRSDIRRRERPSVIPSEAKMDVFVRSLMVETLIHSARIDDILDGAALMAGVTVSAPGTLTR